MADEAACDLQYENKTNHNLDLQADVRLTKKRKRIRHRTRKRSKNKMTGKIISIEDKNEEPEEPKIKRQKHHESEIVDTHRPKTQEPINYEILSSDEEMQIKVENLDNEINEKIGESSKENDENFYGKVKKEEGAEANNDRLSHPENFGVSEEIKKEISLNPYDIDAYWLPSGLNKLSNEAFVSQEKTAEVMEILKDAGNDRECENRLLVSLGLSGLDFIKQLIKLRHMIAFCTTLASSQSERQDIRNKMNDNPALSKILRQLDILQQVGNAGEGEENDEGCQLPSDSIRIRKKEYEEVHIPAMKPKPFGKNEKLIPIDELPVYVQPAFADLKTLNRIQSQLKQKALDSDEDFLLCAPTCAGKTSVALLAIMREIIKHVNADGLINLDEFKLIYAVSVPSQVQEKVDFLRKKLESYNLTVSELTGDDQSKREQMAETQVIVCTSQKRDILHKNGAKDIFSFPVKLIITDDIHLMCGREYPYLKNLKRKTNKKIWQTKENIRLIGLSTNLPNCREFATCLRIKPETGLFYFDNSFRPAALELQCIGVIENNSQVLNGIIYEKIIKQAGRNQVLIFTLTHNQTEKTARAIFDKCSRKNTLGQFLRKGSASMEVLRMKSEKAKNHELRKLLRCGFAVHHAGLKMADKTLVEKLFVDKCIQVLFTDTLNWGVELLAHTVIIKGTKVHNSESDRSEELGTLEVLRMLGRAGYPEYDTTCEGILITDHNKLQNYLSLLTEQEQ